MHPGTPWPAKNDGRVVVRALLRGGLRPGSDDQRVLSYAAQWTGSSKGLWLGVGPDPSLTLTITKSVVPQRTPRV